MNMTTQLPKVPIMTLISRFTLLEIAGAQRKLFRLIGIRRPRSLSLEDLVIPDSHICKKATDIVRKCEPDFLFNHSVRSYLFGLAVGQNIGLTPDRELLYLACILHDIGLTPEHDGVESFELQSSRAARSFLEQEEQAEDRIELVHEAIALHTSAGIAGLREPEIALTHFGTGFDVLGVRSEDVSSSTKKTIVEHWPRENFKDQFAKLLDGEVDRKPNCHMAPVHKLGFSKMIRRAPFSE